VTCHWTAACYETCNNITKLLLISIYPEAREINVRNSVSVCNQKSRDKKTCALCHIKMKPVVESLPG